MTKYTKLLKILLVLLLMVVFGVFLLRKADNNPTKNNTVPVQNQEITIDTSQFVGKTALEATITSLNGKVKTKGDGINAYVTSIQGREADIKKNEFWELDVNGKPAEVGAGSYILKAGDKIVWKINTF